MNPVLFAEILSPEILIVAAIVALALRGRILTGRRYVVST